MNTSIVSILGFRKKSQFGKSRKNLWSWPNGDFSTKICKLGLPVCILRSSPYGDLHIYCHVSMTVYILSFNSMYTVISWKTSNDNIYTVTLSIYTVIFGIISNNYSIHTVKWQYIYCHCWFFMKWLYTYCQMTVYVLSNDRIHNVIVWKLQYTYCRWQYVYCHRQSKKFIKHYLDLNWLRH